jgi:3,4-dihydroxy 2-butanone 4-phosphate synthase/GTP cyclohydrolase II
VLVRAGQTEAAVDLAKLAGLAPAGVICEIMKADGSMARVPDLLDFCKVHNLNMISVADLIRYRTHAEHFFSRSEPTQVPAASSIGIGKLLTTA